MKLSAEKRGESVRTYVENGVEYIEITKKDGSKETKTKEMGAASVIDGIASGLSGSLAMYLGSVLFRSGILSCGSLGDDDKEEKYNELKGDQKNAVHLDLSDFGLGKVSFTMDWLAPTAMPVLMGAELAKTA